MPFNKGSCNLNLNLALKKYCLTFYLYTDRCIQSRGKMPRLGIEHRSRWGQFLRIWNSSSTPQIPKIEQDHWLVSQRSRFDSQPGYFFVQLDILNSYNNYANKFDCAKIIIIYFIFIFSYIYI